MPDVRDKHDLVGASEEVIGEMIGAAVGALERGLNATPDEWREALLETIKYDLEFLTKEGILVEEIMVGIE